MSKKLILARFECSDVVRAENPARDGYGLIFFIFLSRLQLELARKIVFLVHIIVKPTQFTRKKYFQPLLAIVKNKNIFLKSVYNLLVKLLFSIFIWLIICDFLVI